MKKPTTKVKAHGAVSGVRIMYYGKRTIFPFGVTIGASTREDVCLLGPHAVREMGEFLLKAADYIEWKERK